MTPKRSPVTTHILDLETGLPAAHVQVNLENLSHGKFTSIGKGRTNGDGRIESLLPVDFQISTGTYRLTFETGEYFKARGQTTFFPHVEITFNITDIARHHHVPLLLSPFGYSTYRGS